MAGSKDLLNRHPVRNGINIGKQAFTFFTAKRSCLLDNIWDVNMYNIYIVDMWGILLTSG